MRLLKAGDIDVDEGKILVCAEISKNKKSQFVTIPEPLLNELFKKKIHFYNEDYYVFSKKGEPSEEPVSRDYFNKLHCKILRSFGIGSRYSLYSWKGTGAVEAVKAGINLKDLQMQIRHFSLDIVGVYLQSMGVLQSEALKVNFPQLG